MGEYLEPMAVPLRTDHSPNQSTRSHHRRVMREIMTLFTVRTSIRTRAKVSERAAGYASPGFELGDRPSQAAGFTQGPQILLEKKLASTNLLQLQPQTPIVGDHPL